MYASQNYLMVFINNSRKSPGGAGSAGRQFCGIPRRSRQRLKGKFVLE
jgi:hypothetical protein